MVAQAKGWREGRQAGRQRGRTAGGKRSAPEPDLTVHTCAHDNTPLLCQCHHGVTTAAGLRRVNALDHAQQLTQLPRDKSRQADVTGDCVAVTGRSTAACRTAVSHNLNSAVPREGDREARTRKELFLSLFFFLLG